MPMLCAELLALDAATALTECSLVRDQIDIADNSSAVNVTPMNLCFDFFIVISQWMFRQKDIYSIHTE
jgi:hypothetical protein